MMRLLKTLSIAILISSCSTPMQKLNKINDKHPIDVSEFCKDKFPCVTSGSDTIVKTEYEYVEIACSNDTITQTDTLFIPVHSKPKTYTITKTKFVALPKEVTVITKYIKDSAEIINLKDKLAEVTEARLRLYKKFERRVQWMNWLIIALAVSLFVNTLFVTNKK